MATKSVRAPMSRSRRAAQFAAFDALKGLKEAIKKKEEVPEERHELTPDRISEIDASLRELRKNDVVTVVYYSEYSQHYQQLTGRVEKVDPYWKNIQINSTVISFSELDSICQIEAMQ